MAIRKLDIVCIMYCTGHVVQDVGFSRQLMTIGRRQTGQVIEDVLPSFIAGEWRERL